MENMDNQQQPEQQQDTEQQPYQTYNTTQVPDELKKWSWGAFMFTLMWGIGHKCYKALFVLIIIPPFPLIWAIITGVKGNEWLWETGQFKTVEELKKVQEPWNRAGFVYFWIAIAAVILYFFVLMAFGFALFSNYSSDLY